MFYPIQFTKLYSSVYSYGPTSEVTVLTLSVNGTPLTHVVTPGGAKNTILASRVISAVSGEDHSTLPDKYFAEMECSGYFEDERSQRVKECYRFTDSRYGEHFIFIELFGCKYVISELPPSDDAIKLFRALETVSAWSETLVRSAVDTINKNIAYRP